MSHCIDYDGYKWYKRVYGKYNTIYYTRSTKKAKLDNKPSLLHRYIWEKYNGKISKGYVVHHINHNSLDNRIENLKLLSNSKHTSHHSNLYHSGGADKISIEQLTMDGKPIKIWDSMSEASRNIIGKDWMKKEIKKCCEGKMKSTHNYKWRYKNEVYV